MLDRMKTSMTKCLNKLSEEDIEKGSRFMQYFLEDDGNGNQNVCYIELMVRSTSYKEWERKLPRLEYEKK